MNEYLPTGYTTPSPGFIGDLRPVTTRDYRKEELS